MTEAMLKHEIAHEQDYVTMLYEVLDRARARATADLQRVHGGPTTGTEQAATERDSFAGTYAVRSTQLLSVERGLCFGRIDRMNGAAFYIGRIAVFDENFTIRCSSTGVRRSRTVLPRDDGGPDAGAPPTPSPLRTDRRRRRRRHPRSGCVGRP